MYSDHYSSKRELAKQLVFLNKDWKSQHQRVIGIIYQCQIIRWRGMHIHNVRGRPGQVQLHAQRPYRCLLPKPAHIVSGSRWLNSRAQAPGKVKVKAKALVTQSCLTLHDHMNCSLSGSSVHGILQARILEWVAMLSSRVFSQPRDPTRISYVSCIGRRALYHESHLGSPFMSRDELINRRGLVSHGIQEKSSLRDNVGRVGENVLVLSLEEEAWGYLPKDRRWRRAFDGWIL